MTILEHPLNDIHPLSFGKENDLIATKVEILYSSMKTPLVAVYNSAN